MSRVRKATEVILTQPVDKYPVDTVFTVKFIDGDDYVCFAGPAAEVRIPKSKSRWWKAA